MRERSYLRPMSSNDVNNGVETLVIGSIKSDRAGIIASRFVKPRSCFPIIGNLKADGWS
jgi:hypothetical protein